MTSVSRFGSDVPSRPGGSRGVGSSKPAGRVYALRARVAGKESRGRGVEGSTQASIAFAVIGLLLGGCFFTDDINIAPTAEIQQTNPEVALFSGDNIVLSASKSADEDGDPLTFSWTARSCPSMNQCQTEFASLTSTTGDPGFTVTIPSKNLVSVELVVRDSHGAQADTQQFFTILNRAPTVSVQVQGISSPTGGFTVGRPLVVIASATDMDDGPDDLDLIWTPFPEAGSDPKVREWTELTGVQCPLPPGSENVKQECYHLRPDVDGLWRVQVEVTDGVEGDDITESILIDPDMPPCIETTAPQLVAGATYILERSDEVRRFAALSVTDELDPYPLPPNDNDPDRGTATFRWWIATPDTSGLRVKRQDRFCHGTG